MYVRAHGLNVWALVDKPIWQDGLLAKVVMEEQKDEDQNYNSQQSTTYLVQADMLLCTYQARPTQKHLKEVKSIFNILKGYPLTWDSVSKGFCFELNSIFQTSDHGRVPSILEKALLEGLQFLGHSGKTNVFTAEKISVLSCYFPVRYSNHIGEEISCHLLYASVEIPGKCVDRRLIGAFLKWIKLGKTGKQHGAILHRIQLVPVYELTVHLSMEMEIQCSNKSSYTACGSFLNESFEDIMKAQVSVFKASATLNIQDQEKCEHIIPNDTSSQDGKRSHDDD
ncbi:hypothetical protein Tco_0725623 [Tanacetum coccineum]|uniref:Uncharacterized protein n=1 Tax=Tanacetum coccineum TaxID=301880 RepID=A0ABQ4YFL1_9ASTR